MLEAKVAVLSFASTQLCDSDKSLPLSRHLSFSHKIRAWILFLSYFPMLINDDSMSFVPLKNLGTEAEVGEK